MYPYFSPFSPQRLVYVHISFISIRCMSFSLFSTNKSYHNKWQHSFLVNVLNPIHDTDLLTYNVSSYIQRQFLHTTSVLTYNVSSYIQRQFLHTTSVLTYNVSSYIQRQFLHTTSVLTYNVSSYLQRQFLHTTLVLLFHYFDSYKLQSIPNCNANTFLLLVG